MRVGRRQALNKEKPHPAMQGGVFSLWAVINTTFATREELYEAHAGTHMPLLACLPFFT